jgi:asparagine synthase (glutamine-hydrolysing)
MKIDRYLAIVVADGRPRSLHDEFVPAGAALDLTPRFQTDRLMVLSSPETEMFSLGAGGIVVGTVFPRDANSSTESLAAGARNTGGKLLVTSAWGDYVSFVHGGSETSILRSPSGRLHAFRCRSNGLMFIASDCEILTALGVARPAIDWEFVAQHLAFPHLLGAATGLSGVDEIRAGERAITGDRATVTEQVWSPWDHILPARAPADHDGRCAELRRVVQTSVRTLASRYEHIVLELSGGLDSSIVAAALSGEDASISALNLVTPTREGDERSYARQVAAHCELPLVEARPADDVDLTTPLTEQFPRPGLPGVLRAWEGGLIRAARETDAEAFFSGTGGDNVFCSLGSAAPATDALIALGPGRTYWRAVGNVASLHDTTLWNAAVKSVAQFRRRRRSTPWPRTVAFLRIDVLPTSPAHHPWLTEPDNLTVGKRSHVRSIMAAQAHLDGYSRHSVAPSVFPLLSQPVIETCLAIPTWQWIEGGRDRAVARDAFRQDLPASVVGRQTKGMMNAYCGRAYERNRAALHRFLLEGHLAARGLIDRPALASYLDGTGPVRDIAFYGVLTIADVELWIRSWLGDP